MLLKINPFNTVLLWVILSYRNWICIKKYHQMGAKNSTSSSGLNTNMATTPVSGSSCMQDWFLQKDMDFIFLYKLDSLKKNTPSSSYAKKYGKQTFYKIKHATQTKPYFSPNLALHVWVNLRAFPKNTSN